MRQPLPFFINNGVPYTDLNARTGEFTPPGKNVLAFAYNSADFSLLISGLPIVFTGISSSPENIFFNDPNILYFFVIARHEAISAHANRPCKFAACLSRDCFVPRNDALLLLFYKI